MDKDRKGILQRLSEGPVIGDGSMCMTLEKRGYCRAGPWTPEAVVEYPDAVLQLQREYLRAGADVIQTASFYASDDKLCIGAGEKGFGHTVDNVIVIVIIFFWFSPAFITTSSLR